MRRMFHGLLILAILIITCSDSSFAQNGYVVRIYQHQSGPLKGLRLPYIYPPGHGPSKKVIFRSSSKKILGKHKTKWNCYDVEGNFEVGTKPLSIVSSCAGSFKKAKSYYCYFQLKDDFLHQPRQPYYNDHKPSKSKTYTDFWTEFASCIRSLEEKKNLIDPNEAAKIFGEKLDAFVEYLPMSFEDSLKKTYGLERMGADPVSITATNIKCKLTNQVPLECVGKNKPGKTGEEHMGGLYIDIRPGMRLKIQHSIWQNAPAPGRALGKQVSNKDEETMHLEEGYAMNGTEYVHVTLRHANPSFQNWRNTSKTDDVQNLPFLAFDFFLGFLKQHYHVVEQTVLKWPRKASGVIDFHFKSARCRYYRLRIPPNYQSGDNSDSSPQECIMFIGSNKKSDLKALRVEKLFGNELKWYSQKVDNSENPSIPFMQAIRGRPWVTPEVRIQINDDRPYLPIGITYRDIQYMLKDKIGKKGPKIKVLRPYKGNLVPMEFQGSDPELFDLPILKGDVIRLCR